MFDMESCETPAFRPCCLFCFHGRRLSHDLAVLCSALCEFNAKEMHVSAPQTI